MKPVALCVLFSFVWYLANAKTIIVSASQSLQQTIRSANAYDTLILKPGKYPSINTEIKIPLTIIGEKGAILDGEMQDEVISILSNDVSISGVEVCNTKRGSMKDYTGIRVFKAQRVQIRNCILNNTYFGIYLSDSKNITVSNCRSKGANYGHSDTGNGVHLWKCDSITILDNHFEGHRDGIYLEFAKNCFIQNNLCEKNFRYGLHFMFSDNDTYTNNTFTNNGTGVAVMYSKGVHMFHNRFENNWGDASYGLLLKEMSYGSISNNLFKSNTVGVTMEGGTNMRMEHNRFEQNGYALKVMANCRLDTFMYNNFSGNTFDAATNGELRENLFSHNYWDKYEGYDLNRDGIGDVPYRPVSLYSVIVEKMPYAVMLMRSFTIELLNRAERSLPSIVPDTFVDEQPLMRMIAKLTTAKPTSVKTGNTVKTVN